MKAEDINAYYDALLAGRSGRPPVTGMTVSKRHANISKALKYAVRKDYIPSADAIMEKVNCPKKETFTAKFLKVPQLVELCGKAKGHKLELPIYLGGFYGLRLSEVIGLQWKSINFDTNSFTIGHTVTVAGGKLNPLDKTKNKSSRRTLPLDPLVKDMLLKIKEEQELNRKLCGKSWGDEWNGYVNVDAVGDLIKPGYITEMFPKFVVRNGFNRIRFHDLRHTCASLRLANGDSMKEVQEWLGHSSYNTTANLYAHLTYDNKIASSDRMSPIIEMAIMQNVV